MIKIKGYYLTDSPLYYNIIETEDGKLYRFYISPYRKLTRDDLEEIITPLSKDMYLKTVHAEKPLRSSEHDLSVYGLEPINPDAIFE